MAERRRKQGRPHGGLEQRVWMHYRSMKGYLEFKVDRVADGLTPAGLVYGHYEPTTPNHVWLRLARVHKLSVREVKDIINIRRAMPGARGGDSGPTSAD